MPPNSSNPVISATGERARPEPVPMTVTDMGPFRPAGMATTDFRIPAGADGIITDVRAAMQEFRNTSQMLLEVSQRTTQFLGNARDVLQEVGAIGGSGAASPVMRDLLASQKATLKQITRLTEIAAVSGYEGIVHPGTRGAPGSAPTGGGPGGGTPKTDTPEGKEPAPWTGPRQRLSQLPLDQHRVGFIRSRAAAEAERIQGGGAGTFRVQEGENIPLHIPGLAGPVGIAPAGSDVTRDASGVYRAATRGEQLGAHVRRRTGGTLGALAEGETGIMELGRAFLPEIAGPLAGYEALNKGAQFVSDQRAAGARYQAILGGTTAAGEVQRAEGYGFGLRNAFGMGRGQAEQLFQNVTSMGLQGGNRQQYLNFATEAFRTMGMTPDELQPIMQAARDTGTNLGQLETALQGVSEAARTAGVSSQAARQGFLNIFRAAGQVAPGSAATTAAIVQSGLTALGPQFQNVDASGQFQERGIRLQAALTRQTVGSYVDAMNQPGAAGALAGARGRQAATDWASRSYMGGRLTQVMPQVMQRLGIRPGQAVRPEQTQQLMHALEQATGGQLDPYLAQRVLSNAGIQADPNQALQMLAMSAGGINNQVTTAQNYVNQSKVFSLSGANLRELQSGARPGANDRLSSLLGQAGINLGTFGGRGVLGAARGGDAIGRGQKGDQEQFARDLLRGGGGLKAGQFSETIAKLVSTNDPSRRYKVAVGGGAERVVTLGEGLKYYADQFAKGDVQIVAGQGQGQTVAQATNTFGDPSQKVSTAQQHRGVGQTLKDWNKDSGGQSGKITVTADPNLKGIIKLITSGSVVTNSPLAPPPQPNAGTGPYTTTGP